ALDHAWVDTTLLKYCGVVQQFQRFCMNKGVASPSQLPASKEPLCAYAASHLGSLAGDTVQNYMAVIKAWHIYNNVAWQGGVRLRYILNGVRNLALASSKKAPHLPVTHVMLVLLAGALDHANGMDIYCFAAICCAFWGQCWLGEILLEWEKSFKGGRVVCHHHLTPAFNEQGS
ncbi:hypothetical protein BS17DRAFT_695420, partial [Gyrodon lividus]